MKVQLLCALLALSLPAGPAGKLTGKVRFEGERPEKKPLVVEAAAAKGCCPEGEKVDAADPSLLIAEDGGLANVVVTVDVPGAKLEVPEKAFEIDQKKCSFEPHVLVVPAGSKVVFLNSDAVTHNVHTLSQKNEDINKTTAPGGKEELLLARGDRVFVRCDYHPWMSSCIYVTESPYYAVTKADGSFEIPGLPPGTYSATFWQEKLGRVKQDVTIKPDGSSDPVEPKLSVKKKKDEKGEKPGEKPKN
jgi:plastocyanin